MNIYFATDHAGYEMKNKLLSFVQHELGYNAEDCGAHSYDEGDDYPDFIAVAAKKVGADPHGSRAIILGASGQGEAIAANRVPHVRAVVYYGAPRGEQVDASGESLDMIASTRAHNDANVLSIGARFVDLEEAKRVVKDWLETPFSGAERHQRRIDKIDS